MTDSDVNILTLKKYYLLVSEETNRIYLDKNFYCYIFELKSTAESFVASLKRPVRIEEEKSYRLRDYFCDFFAHGACGICVYQRDKEKEVIALTFEDASKNCYQFYNNKAFGNLLRLIQTKEKQYLRNLRDVTFFAPVYVKERTKKQYPYVRYCYARTDDPYRYFILFATIQDFTAWNETQEQKWSPMEVSISKFNRIRKNNPVLINPMAEKIIFTHPHIKTILEKV